jgi:hypothetical protein
MNLVSKFLFTATLLVVASCKLQPDAEDLLTDMVVVTNYNETVNFDNFVTYAMLHDSVGLITNDSRQMEWIDDSYSKAVNTAIRSNLTATGRTRVGKSQSPDLAVNVYVVEDIQNYQSIVYPNYYGYPGYGGYGGYYGYSGYYGYPQVINYQSQTAIMIIEFVDMINVDPATNETRVIWTANIGDLLNSYDREGKVLEAINQAFAQSEYLKR